ncbi:hypothetical protein ACFFKH_16865 [Micromonospora marina]|uniref:Uncharacterized protein n=1 Tax=Micromonospora marina TaxID=307120 RepID=A0A1C5AFW4_9ACTN|nr:MULTISPECIES: hypothetical protein [Micromonospora]SCF44117.1 hypothetical protein GA0070215_12944 [Micromonospora marina]
MTEHLTGRAVWRRTATGARTADEDERLSCGGREPSVEERYLIMRERRLARKAEERARAEAEARTAGPASQRRSDDEEEDDLKAAERFRNDRYAVKLLHQDDAAWTGGGAGPGVLG